MDNKKFEDYLRKIRNNISNMYNQFYVWKTLQNRNYSKIYNRNKYFWGIVIYSLENNFFLNLTKLFEKRNDIISIYSLIDFIQNPRDKRKVEQKIKFHQVILDRLWKWRCKIFAHEDKQTFLNLKKFYKDYPLKYSEIEKLLNLAKELLGDIESTVKGEGHSYSYKVFEDESRRDVEDIIKYLELVKNK